MCAHADGYRLPSNPTMLRGGSTLVNQIVSHPTRPVFGCSGPMPQPTRRRIAAPAATVPATPPATAAAKTPARAALRPVR